MLRITALLLLVAMSVPRLGHGARITVAFEGVLTRAVDDYDLFGGAGEGTRFSGAYFYDDAAAMSVPCPTYLSTDRCAVYDFGEQSTAGISLDVGGNTFSLSDEDEGVQNPLTVFIRNDHTDEFRVEWARRIDGIGADDAFRIRASDPFQSFLESTDLIVPTIDGLNDPPLYFFNFTARRVFDRQEVRIVDGRPIIVRIPGQTSEVGGGITSLRIVPEPTAVVLLGVALVGGIALRHGS